MFFTPLSLLSGLSPEWQLVVWSLVVTVLISVPFFVRHFSMQAPHEVTPFPFLDLPRELRDIVYENLIQNPSYPPCTPSPKALSRFGWLLPQRPAPSTSNWVMLSNHQVYEEYMDLLCKQAKFTLTVDQKNAKERDIWPIRSETLKQIRKCDLRLVTTSKMLGAEDPRTMPKDWPLRDKICERLRGVQKAEDLNLHVRAIGDPLWNPLWVWYHASQAFKDSAKPCFQRITFSLDTWSPGENLLARNKEGQWEWRCRENHFVATDAGQYLIREFCSALYAECQDCPRR
ncbi:hypothetical protein K432DRAFT_382408 [Lepidopterella palustris CBS 459.81]|uniref:Uncharacterized protein n=1 Tax=Lepidopterella palustris CBS 459.81 TaxID=1314670 RepID=A0A8E2EA40_9PEZI|nr:hypothetical protein K432DRAFT_382408 [Lepidopterella palustris CBS 459.81]